MIKNIEQTVHNFLKNHEMVKFFEENREFFLTMLQKYDDDHCEPLRNELEEAKNEIIKLRNENSILKFMVDNSLGEQDMKNDI